MLGPLHIVSACRTFGTVVRRTHCAETKARLPALYSLVVAESTVVEMKMSASSGAAGKGTLLEERLPHGKFSKMEDTFKKIKHCTALFK